MADDDDTRSGGIPHYIAARGEDGVACLICGMPRLLCGGKGGGREWEAASGDRHRYIADKGNTWPRRYR